MEYSTASSGGTRADYFLEFVYYNNVNTLEEKAIDKLVLKTFKESLVHSLGESLQEIILFGSRARGDENPDSDFDMLVIADGEKDELKKQVREAEWVCMERFNALVSSIIYTPEIWETAKESPLGWNIRREGKRVA